MGAACILLHVGAKAAGDRGPLCRGGALVGRSIGACVPTRTSPGKVPAGVAIAIVGGAAIPYLTGGLADAR